MKRDRASDTARFVLDGIYWVSQHPRLGTEVPRDLARYTEEMVRCVEWRGKAKGSWIDRRVTRMKAGIMQSVSIPGIYLYQVLRKRYIESVARSLVLPNVSQLVVFGAGFDTLSLRMGSSHVGMTVIEVDHPASRAAKLEAIGRFNFSTGPCVFVESDIDRDGVADALDRCPQYDPDAPTLFVAEGLTMYLKESRVRGLFDFVAAGSPESRLLFTYMEEGPDGSWDFREQGAIATRWLARRNERFTWGATPNDLRHMLADCRLEVVEERTAEMLRSDLLSPSNREASLAHGENTVLTRPAG